MTTTVYLDIPQEDDSLVRSIEISVTGRRDVSGAWDFVCGAVESMTCDLTSFDGEVGLTHRKVVMATETPHDGRHVENWIKAKHWDVAKEALEEMYWRERE